MVQIISPAEAAAMIKPGNRLAIGGFFSCWSSGDHH